LLFSLYKSSRIAGELEQAKATLPFILNEAKEGRTSVDVYNPKNWWLGGFPRKEKLSNSRILIYKLPKSCSNLGLQSCICLCQKDTPDDCDEKGVCIDDVGFWIEEKKCISYEGTEIKNFVILENGKCRTSGLEKEENVYPSEEGNLEIKHSIKIEDPPIRLNINQTNKIISN